MLGKNEAKGVLQLHTGKGRERQQRFIAEGVRLCTEILNEKPGCIEKIYATEAYFPTLSKFKLPPDRQQLVTEQELKSISLLTTPNEVLCVCKNFEDEDIKINLDKKCALYLDDIRDPGNMGTIIRLCDWFGMNTLFCSPSSCDMYNPKVVQATMGSILRVKIVYTTLEEVIAKQHPKSIYGALLKGHSLYKEKLEPGLIVLGNEGRGISEENQRLITNPILIPAAPGSRAESLNAAMAASVICAEFFRQLH